MNYDLSRPWLSLDQWQKDYIYSDPNSDCFLLTGRQVGKTTAMSIKAVELCVKHYKNGQNILICSITEKQAYRVLAKALAYAREKYPKFLIDKGKDKPTMHKILFKTGAGIYCYAAGEKGEGLRGDTIKKLMIDEGSRMSEEFFIATTPMLSVARGSMDIASTPCGKEGFFYDCSMDEHFKKFYVSAEDCPRHTKEFLDREKARMSKLMYAQEYIAVFLDELKRFFSDDLIKECCILERKEFEKGIYYLGCDIAGLGEDECTYEIIRKIDNDNFKQVENIIEKRNYTTDTSQKIITLNKVYNFRRIGIDDGGVGFGVFSELLKETTTKRKTEALNNSSRSTDRDDVKHKKLLKEEMYINLLVLMETGKIKLLNDNEIIQSLKSVQHEVEVVEGKPSKTKIFGNYTHITEGIIRSAWLCEKDKHLNIWVK